MGTAEPFDQVSPVVPAGWYSDPSEFGLLRWWDGLGWTEHVAPNPAQLVASPPQISPAAGWIDLALNRPGQAVATKAAEIRASAPKRGFFSRLFGPPGEDRPWEQGAIGERAVGQQLQRLPAPTWMFLHSVPVGSNDSDIDHVVIGPGGVFTLNTKNHSAANVWAADRAIMVNGQKQPYYRNSRHEAQRASKLLTAACGVNIHVEPIIVVLAQRLTIKAQPEGIHVVGRRDIARWLKRRPIVLSAEQVGWVFDHARRSTTWQPDRE